MEEVGSSRMDLDSDIDLESGRTTSEEDVRKEQASSDDHKSKMIGSMSMSSESSYGSGNCSSSSFENLMSSKEIFHKKNKEMQLAKLREDMENSIKMKMARRESAGRPPRPTRPPEGNSLGPYDKKLVKEIYELNLERKRMGRIRAFPKKKRVKRSSMKSSLLAFFVTIIFFLIIILQGLLGSRV